MKHKLLLFFTFVTTFLQAQGFNQYDRLWGTYFGLSIGGVQAHIVNDEQGNIITFEGFTHESNTLGSSSIYNYVQNFIFQSEQISDYSVYDSDFTYFTRFTPEGVLLQAGILPYSVKDVQRDQHQNIIILGETNRTDYGTLNTWLPTITTLPLRGPSYSVIVKLDQQLNKLWCSYVPTKFPWIDNFSHITLDANNNIYGTGQTILRTGIATENAYDSIIYQINSLNPVNTLLYKLNNNGVLQWATYYGLARPTAIEVDDDFVYLALHVDEYDLEDSNLPENYYITPSAYQNTSSNMVLSKFDSNTGHRLLSTYFGEESSEGIRSIKKINGYTYILADIYNMNNASPWITSNAYQPIYGNGVNDLYLGKLDDNFNPIWGTYIGGSGYEFATKINFKEQFIYLSGLTSSPNITLTEESFDTTYNGNGDVFIMKFNLDGNLFWGSYFGSTERDSSISILPVNDQTFYLLGSTLSPKDITTPGAHRYDYNYDSIPYSGYPPFNSFLIKFGRNDDLNTSDISTSTLKIYPNPAKDKVYIKGFIHQDSWIEVYNLVGQKVITQKAKSGLTQTIEVQFLPKGTYIIKAIDINGKVFQDKLLIN